MHCPEKQNRTEKSRTITFPFTIGTNKQNPWSIYLDLAIYLEERINNFDRLSTHHKGKKNQDICNGLLLWVHGIFLCPVLSIFNVIRPPLNPDQEHLSTVEGILSLVTAAVWGYSRWPYTQRVAIKWPSPSKNLVKQLIYMFSGKQDRW